MQNQLSQQGGSHNHEDRMFIVNLRKHIKTYNFNFSFSGLNVYIGNLGNERADDLAKEATLRDINYHPNKRYINKSLYNKCMELWQQSWDTHDKGRNVYCYIDQVNTGKIYLDFYLNQIVAGHGAFPDTNTKCLGS